MKKSQNLLIWMAMCVIITTICGVIAYLDFAEWTGGYIAIFILFRLIVVFGTIAIILLVLFLRTSYKQKELKVSGEKPVFVMKSKEILTWLIICVVICIVFGILASLGIGGYYFVYFGFPIPIIFGIIAIILFFNWIFKRREEADSNQVIESEPQDYDNANSD